MPQVVFHGSRAQLREVLRALPALLSGKAADPTGAVRALWGAVGLRALGLIQEAFLVKAKGGTDAAGITWDKLSPRYVAYGRTHPGLNSKRQQAKAKGRPGRPLLTDKQDALWRRTYAQALARLARQGHAGAKGHAAAIAWRAVKAAGGQTILARYGNAPYEIGRNTGVLFNSLSPGSTPAPANKDQVFDVGPRGVTVGTNVRYAAAFHAKRPLWPDKGRVPESWRQTLAGTLAEGIKRLLALVVK